MNKVFLFILLVLLGITVCSFILGFHTFGYIDGFIFGSVAMGISYVYSSRDDDKFRPNYLNTMSGDQEK